MKEILERKKKEKKKHIVAPITSVGSQFVAQTQMEQDMGPISPI